MIVLGKTSDDKGTQLELLTRKILETLGCRNIVVNFISSGGQEIDLNADYPMPGIGAPQNRRLICECKAYAKPMNIPDWLKFLGKVYSEEARLNSEITGCFIALSGVNGNVSGHYDQLRITRPNIILVKGDTLLDELKKIYEVCEVDKLNEILERFTVRAYRSVEVAYYGEKVYRIVIFDDDSYTILNADGSKIDIVRRDELKPMIEDSLPVTAYIDLEEEAEARKRTVQAKKSVLAQIITNGGKIKTDALVSDEPFKFQTDELQNATATLLNEGWINEANGELILPDEDKDIFYANLSKIYHFLLGGEAKFDLIRMLKSDFHASHINRRFVKEVQHIQGDLPLDDSDVELAIKLLRLSPSAILWSVQPDGMIVQHRTPEGENFDSFDRNYFFRELFRSLRHDLTHPIARGYLLDVFHIREIETTQNVKVKSSIGVELESTLHERTGIGELADGLVGPDGSSNILMLLLEHAPEPWDSPESASNAISPPLGII